MINYECKLVFKQRKPNPCELCDFVVDNFLPLGQRRDGVKTQSYAQFYNRKDKDAKVFNNIIREFKLITYNNGNPCELYDLVVKRKINNPRTPLLSPYCR